LVISRAITNTSGTETWSTGGTLRDGYTIGASAPPPPPVAEFIGTPLSGDAPLAVSFTNQSSGGISSYNWDFGDNNTSTLQNPSHTYTLAGTYAVSLTVTGPDGSDTETKIDYIFVTTPTPPLAGFVGSPLNGAAPLSVSFTDQSSGSITSHNWDFGDGGTSTEQNPSHTYTLAGTHAVSLTVTGPLGSDTDTKIDYITVTGPTTVSLQDGVNGYSGTRDTKLLSTTPNTNYGSAVQLEVDGSPDYSVLLSWDMTSIPLGTTIDSVAITLEITNSSTHMYEFYEMKRPWVESEATWNEYALGQSWQVSGADGSADRGPTVLGGITGSTGTQTISLNSAGVALVQSWVDDPSSNQGFILLDFINASNGLDFFSRETATPTDRPKLTVTYSGGTPPPPPVADFIGTPLSGNAPLGVSFTDQSSGSISSYNWDFGDSNTNTLQNPSHTYTVAGTYTVSLTVTGPGGSDTNTKIDYITVTQASGPITVSLQDGVNGYSGTRDTKLLSTTPNTNYGSAVQLEVDGSPDYSVLLSWDLTSIPSGSTIDLVSVTLEVTNKSGHTYEFYEMKRPWVESEATWNEYALGQSWQVSGADGSADRASTVLGEITGPSLGTQTISLNAAGVALVQSWVDEPSSNHGFILVDYINASNGLDFFSRETATPTNRPKLTVTHSGPPPTAALVTMSFRDGVDGYSGTRETMLSSGKTNTKRGSETDGHPDRSTLLSWDLTSIPWGSIIRSVRITLELSQISKHSYDIYEMKRPWVESEATWNEYALGQSWQVSGADGSADRGSTVLGSISGSSSGTTTVSLNAAGVAVVQSWVNNPSLNHGFIFPDYISTTHKVNFSSAKTGPVANRPKLTVTYFRAPPIAKIGFDHITTSQLQRLSVDVPDKFALKVNYPNPFNPSTKIRYELPKGGKVNLRIFDLLGREVAVLVDEEKQAGRYEVDWQPGNISTGVYLYRLQAGDFVETKKLILLK